MKKFFTSKVLLFKQGLGLVTLLSASLFSQAQVSCPGAQILYSESFGAGTNSTAWADVIPGSLYFYQSGLLSSEGYYRTIDSTQQKPEWHVSGDHTGDTHGKMLVVNGRGETFFRHEIGNAAFLPGTYKASAFVMNIDPLGLCGVNALLPVMVFTVEYFDANGLWTPLQQSPFKSSPLSQTASPEWVNIGGGFVLPETPGFVVTRMRITIGDEVANTVGCGSDFALDDIELALCPTGVITPVTFVDVNAHLQGNNAVINWSTSQESNSDYFQVQRSNDGNTGWSVVSTLPAAGNSQVLKNYKAVDANAISGITYYRIKQFDKDGKFAYSKTVSVKPDNQKLSASVLANPFHNRLAINISSPVQQMLTARLVDITGKLISTEKWSVSNGRSTKQFSNISSLQQGMYIITVFGSNGEVLLNNKVIKQ